MLKVTIEAAMPCSPVKLMQKRKTTSKELVHPHASLGVGPYIRNPRGDEPWKDASCICTSKIPRHYSFHLQPCRKLSIHPKNCQTHHHRYPEVVLPPSHVALDQ
jgi:hypothetical protein